MNLHKILQNIKTRPYDTLKVNQEEFTRRTKLPIALPFLLRSMIMLLSQKLDMHTYVRKPICCCQMTEMQKNEGNLLLMWQNSKKNDNNHFSNCSLKILNLHWKSKNQQIKNIARSVNELGIALCSCFVGILIFYANLKFSMDHGTLTKQVFYSISLVFSAVKQRIWD